MAIVFDEHGKEGVTPPITFTYDAARNVYVITTYPCKGTTRTIVTFAPSALMETGRPLVGNWAPNVSMEPGQPFVGKWGEGFEEGPNPFQTEPVKKKRTPGPFEQKSAYDGPSGWGQRGEEDDKPNSSEPMKIMHTHPVPKPTVGFVYNPPDPAPWNSDPGGNF